MNKLDIRIIEFMQTIPGSQAQIEQVATYNESVIPEDAVRDLIRIGMWVLPHPFVIFTTPKAIR